MVHSQLTNIKQNRLIPIFPHHMVIQNLLIQSPTHRSHSFPIFFQNIQIRKKGKKKRMFNNFHKSPGSAPLFPTYNSPLTPRLIIAGQLARPWWGRALERYRSAVSGSGQRIRSAAGGLPRVAVRTALNLSRNPPRFIGPASNCCLWWYNSDARFQSSINQACSYSQPWIEYVRCISASG